jgi:hypothetical protein
MSEEFYGAWFICDECVNYIADLFGYVHPERARAIQDESARVLTENISLASEVNALRYAVREITSTLEPIEELNASSVDFSLSDVDSDAGSSSESDVLAAEHLQESERQLDFGERTPDEPGDVEGLADLHTTSSKPSGEFSLFPDL